MTDAGGPSGNIGRRVLGTLIVAALALPIGVAPRTLCPSIF